MTDVQLRAAEPADAVDIARLMTQLGYPTAAAEMEQRLRALFTQQAYITLVAVVDQRVVGVVGAWVGQALEFSEPYGLLTGLVVDERWRGRGVGRLLMGAIESGLKEKGVALLVITSGTHRTEAHRFYQHLGYETTGVRFAKRL